MFVLEVFYIESRFEYILIIERLILYYVLILQMLFWTSKSFVLENFTAFRNNSAKSRQTILLLET